MTTINTLQRLEYLNLQCNKLAKDYNQFRSNVINAFCSHPLISLHSYPTPFMERTLSFENILLQSYVGLKLLNVKDVNGNPIIQNKKTFSIKLENGQNIRLNKTSVTISDKVEHPTIQNNGVILPLSIFKHLNLQQYNYPILTDYIVSLYKKGKEGLWTLEHDYKQASYFLENYKTLNLNKDTNYFISLLNSETTKLRASIIEQFKQEQLDKRFKSSKLDYKTLTLDVFKSFISEEENDLASFLNKEKPYSILMNYLNEKFDFSILDDDFSIDFYDNKFHFYFNENTSHNLLDFDFVSVDLKELI